MHISAVELRLLTAELVDPFNTSYGSILSRNPIIVRVFGDGHEGWSECPADVAPSADRNPVGVAWSALEYRIAGQVIGLDIDHPLSLSLDPSVPRPVRAAMEMAVWDLHARSLGLPLWHVLGGEDRPIPSGVVVGIPETVPALLATVADRVEQGYQRVKLKIKPGWDAVPIEAVRSRWPGLAVSADANGAYTPADKESLREMDTLELQYLEQPFAAPDIEESARFAGTVTTPICLDESLPDRASVHRALTRHPDFVINAKPSRLGGHGETVAVHRLARDVGADLWCGGYLETGIGRAHLVAVATLPGFTLPADISASARYWKRDLVRPEWTLRDGSLIPTGAPGIGVEVDTEYLDHLTTRRILLEV